MCRLHHRSLCLFSAQRKMFKWCPDLLYTIELFIHHFSCRFSSSFSLPQNQENYFPPSSVPESNFIITSDIRKTVTLNGLVSVRISPLVLRSTPAENFPRNLPPELIPALTGQWVTDVVSCAETPVGVKQYEYRSIVLASESFMLLAKGSLHHHWYVA